MKRLATDTSFRPANRRKEPKPEAEDDSDDFNFANSHAANLYAPKKEAAGENAMEKRIQHQNFENLIDRVPKEDPEAEANPSIGSENLAIKSETIESSLDSVVKTEVPDEDIAPASEPIEFRKNSEPHQHFFGEEKPKEEPTNMESDFGLTEYVSKSPPTPISCNFQVLYSDFIVREILADGTVLKMPDTNPKEGLKIDYDIPKPEHISQETLQEIDKLFETGEREVCVAVPGLNEKEQKQIHRFIWERYSRKLVTKREKGVIVVHDQEKYNSRERPFWDTDTTPKYCHFTVCKQFAATQDVVQRLVELVKYTNPADVRYHETKEKNAIAFQRFSVPYVCGSAVMKLNLKLINVRVGDAEYHPEPVGSFWGNRFSLILRNIPRDSIGVLNERLAKLKTNGFINYVATQRFGTRFMEEAEIGLTILKEDWQTAVKLILKNTLRDIHRTTEDSLKEAITRFLETGEVASRWMKDIKKGYVQYDAYHIIRRLANRQSCEVAILKGLCIEKRSRYVQAYQSLLWNRMVSEKVRENGEGEDICIPMPGSQDPTFANKWADGKIKELLEKDRLTQDSFSSLGNKVSLAPSPRRLFMNVKELEWSILEYSTPKDQLQDDLSMRAFERSGHLRALQIHFSLPAGSDPIVVLREVTGTDVTLANRMKTRREEEKRAIRKTKLVRREEREEKKKKNAREKLQAGKNMKFNSFSLILLFLPLSFGTDSLDLASTSVTRWGDWHEFAKCPDGQYAHGMQIKYSYFQHKGDDTALNAVKLYCQELDYDGYRKDNWIMSGEGAYGFWQSVRYCPAGTAIIGFVLRSQIEQRREDDMAAVNFRAYCGTPHGPRTADVRIEGDTESWGNWKADQFCPQGYVVCAIKSQIEKPQGGRDDTALNNVNLKCCRVPIANCTLGHSLVQLAEYDNRGGVGTVTASFVKHISYTRTTGSTSTFTNQERQAISKQFSQSVGFSIGGALFGINLGFTSSVNTDLSKTNEKITTKELQSMVQDAMTNERAVTVQFTVPPQSRLIIEQLFITCGQYRLGLAKTITRSE
ncbi:unnamed protein product [Caenorhabditis sp. 36 PRJEB53466]|nr:unnamed protein product [Caenorhabditis sp. 36 PRJEB53466]